MVVKRRLLLAVVSALSLAVTVTTSWSAAAMAAGTSEATPAPLRSGSLLRLKDFAANGNTAKGSIAAVGWHEASRPGRLFLAFSIDGGRDYSRTNGRLRRYPIVGEPSLGMSIAICANRVWTATAFHSASDKAGDSDVFLTSRTIGGGAAQALMTSTADDRGVRDVSISCVGNKLLAVGWLERGGNKVTAQLMLRSTDPLGGTPRFKEVFNLGRAELMSGLDVAATPTSAAAVFVRDGNLQLKRFDVGAGNPGTVTAYPTRAIARKDIKYPRVAARGQRLVVAFSDAGRVRAKLSRDLGATFGSPRNLVNTGGVKNPSRTWSVDVIGDEITATVGAYTRANGGKVTPQRLTSSDFGERWSRRSFTNAGARMAAYMKKKQGLPLLREAWHDNAPKGSLDTLRALYELP